VETVESGTTKNHSLLRARQGAHLGNRMLLPGILPFPSGNHSVVEAPWTGDGQAVLGGIVVSFWFGIAFAIAASIFLLLRTIPRSGVNG